MENATDALYMGFAVIAFVVALSLSIFSFSEVTSASQRIINTRDKTSMYNYVEPKGTAREATVEDIVPTLYRAYYENYLVRFEGLTQINGLYKVKVEEKDANGNVTIASKPTFTIDLEAQKVGNHQDADALITALLQGNLDSLFMDRTRFSYFEGLQNPSFYDILKRNTFTEKIGLFYMEDRTTNANANTSNKEVDDINKTKKRIITYICKPKM